MTAPFRARPLPFATAILVTVLVAALAAPVAGQRPGPVASRGPHALRLAGVTTPGAPGSAIRPFGHDARELAMRPLAHDAPELAMRWRGVPLGSGAVQDERRPTLLLLGGGLAGGAVGFIGGGLAGAAIACDEDDTSEGFCAIGGFVVGSAIGESALIPLGVHLANRRRGNYGLALLASAAIAGAGLAVAISQGEGAWLIPVPIAQLATSIAIERGTARQTGREDRSPP